MDGIGIKAETSAWTALERELDRWPDGAATFWWRDDDATAATAALDRLLALADDRELPLALAVIPGAMAASLGERLQGERRVGVLQHGYVHVNHAGTGKKMELSANRHWAAVTAELAAGARRLHDLFPGRSWPVLVPPWNRIAPALLPLLPAAGFSHVSQYGPRQSAEPAPNLGAINTHVDPIDWRGSRGTLSEARVLGALTAHLTARRGAAVDGREPTGLLTHHLDMDEAGWRLVERLLERLAGHRAVRWLAPDRLFPVPAW